MRIAFASGKGGAGKTTVAASLAAIWPHPCLIVDADVEAPNLHLFLHPHLDAPQSVYLTVPELDTEKCTACGDCAAMCSYKAIAKLGAGLIIFADMCHGCGGCFEVCQAEALKKGKRELGSLQWGSWSLKMGPAQNSDQSLNQSSGQTSGRASKQTSSQTSSQHSGKTLLMGKSRVGEAMSPPLLRAIDGALAAISGDDAGTVPDILIDSPPGVSCPAMTTARMADALVLVAEPTPFGIYDFKLAHAAFKKLNMPLAVVMNRVGMPGNESGDAVLEKYCAAEGLPLLARLPFDLQAAEAYAHGYLPLLDQSVNALIWQRRFGLLYEAVQRWAGGKICHVAESGSAVNICASGTTGAGHA
ncbi:MAG: 4Fe-4S binding protein [Desulfovibrio sp.]|uniref:nucleotide-binding protein n=1 Tax=Desulfovibrio sp. TaxID=885 RepID=UPI0039E34975